MSSSCNLLGREQSWDTLGNGDIGGWIKPFAAASGADFIDNRRKVRLLGPKPHLPKGCRNDFLNSRADPCAPRPTCSWQQRRNPALGAVSAQVVVDWARRESQFGCGASNCVTHRLLSVQYAIQFSRDTRCPGPSLVRRYVFAQCHEPAAPLFLNPIFCPILSLVETRVKS